MVKWAFLLSSIEWWCSTVAASLGRSAAQVNQLGPKVGSRPTLVLYSSDEPAITTATAAAVAPTPAAISIVIVATSASDWLERLVHVMCQAGRKAVDSLTVAVLSVCCKVLCRVYKITLQDLGRVPYRNYLLFETAAWLLELMFCITVFYKPDLFYFIVFYLILSVPRCCALHYETNIVLYCIVSETSVVCLYVCRESSVCVPNISCSSRWEQCQLGHERSLSDLLLVFHK